MPVERINPQTVRDRLQSDEHDTLLVCAYDSEEKFKANHLQGAISLDEFRAKSESLDPGREIVFY